MKREYILLNPAFILSQLPALCTEAIENNIEQISVPPLLVKKTADILVNTSIRVGSPIGYPFGWNAIEAKLAETILAMVDGAAELELYINITALKNNDWQYLANELNTILTVVKKKQRQLNIVVDPLWLSNEDLIKCCDLYGVAGIECFTLITEQDNSIDAQLQLVRQHIADAITVRAVGITELPVLEGITRYGKIVK